MLIEQPPKILRHLLCHGATWRIGRTERKVYLTFDDGPIPEVTPWVLDLLDKHGVKATFFCVGDNVRKYPEVFAEVKRRGHSYGNHTFNHLRSLLSHRQDFLKNVEKADELIKSSLFRPPHGYVRRSHISAIRKRHQIVMWDVVTRDYDKDLDGEEIFANVKRYVRPGSIIVFHDSLKAERNMKYALPLALEWLKSEGYQFERIPMHEI